MRRVGTLALGISLWFGTQALAVGAPAADPVEPARAALRTLQYAKAIAMLQPIAKSGNAAAQYLLGLIYLNGVGVPPDAARARVLLQSAAEHGSAIAAYVLAGELQRAGGPGSAESRAWLEKSAKLGYARATEALKDSHPLLGREPPSADDAALLTAWVLYCARRDDAPALRALGTRALATRDAFGRGALQHAVDGGAVNAATALLEMGADPKAADTGGVTALMLAAQLPDTRLLEQLTHRGVDLNAADAEHRTALFYAARANRPASVAMLQKAGARLDAQDGRGYTALDAALSIEADEAAASLKALGAVTHVAHTARSAGAGHIDAEHPGTLYRGWQALALAVTRGDAATVQQLLSAGGEVNQQPPGADPLLSLAVDAHALQVIPILLAHGADAGLPDRSGHTVLWRLASREDNGILKLLLDGGVRADTRGRTEDWPLLSAVRARRAANAQLLLAAGARADGTDEDGVCALMVAAAANDSTLLQALLEHKADVKLADKHERTALWYAARGGATDALALLIRSGASSADADAEGTTPLAAAAARGQTAAVAALAAAGASVDSKNRHGDTALVLAAGGGHAETVTALLAKTKLLDIQNASGDTALIAASRGGQAAICHALLAAGANRQLRNSSRLTAADVAKHRGFTALAEELGKG